MYSHIYKAHKSPTFNGGSEIQHLKHGSVIKICKEKNLQFLHMRKPGAMHAIFELDNSYQPSLTSHTASHTKVWLVILQPTCDHGSPINHRQRSNTTDGIGTTPKTRHT